MTKPGNLAKTGPKTLQGKIAVSTNASTHGILSVKPVVTVYESQDQWRAHRKAIMEALRPEGGMEQALADRVVSCSWRLNRVLFFETQTITEQQENLVDKMRKDQRRYSSLYPSDEVDFDAVEEVEKHRAIYEDVVGLYRESIDELASHHTMPWVFLQGPWYAVNLAAFQEDPRYEDNLAVGVLEDVSDTLEEKMRERLNHGIGATVAEIRDALKTLADEAGIEADEQYTAYEGLMEKLGTEAEAEINKHLKKAKTAEKEIISKRRFHILPQEDVLQKVSRYEAHLSREMYNPLHELEALQARRNGGSVPLARIDVQTP
jgi:division protein CdvB (Snf7/Vps24/ESCRT-III family)